jgi:hypothetical protein
VHTVSGGSSPLTPNHAAVACPCGVLERRVVACGRNLDPGEPAASGSARRREARRRPRRAGPRRRRGQAELPSPRSSPPASPSRTGLAQSTRWPARLPAAHPTRGATASLRCSGCSTRGSRFRPSRRFSGATPPWSRRARRRRDRRYRRCRIRVAPPTSLRPNSYRSAALHRALQPAVRRHEGPAEPPVAVPGNRLRPSQRAFSGTHAQVRYWADNGSKQAEAWIFGGLRLDDEEYNMDYGDALRDEVHNDNITPLIGIFDMYSASLAAQHFGGCSISSGQLWFRSHRACR